MTSISYLVDRASRRFAHRVAVVDGERSLTFEEVGNRSSQLANALISLAPKLGSRVAVIMTNRAEVIEIDFAIAKAGKVKAPLNPRLTDGERKFILSNCRASIVLTEASEFDRVLALQPDLPDLAHVISVDGIASLYEDLISGGSPRDPALDDDPSAPSLILHTSGTTGRPKGATLSAGARITATSHMLLEEFAATPEDGMLHVGPMSHGSGSKVLSYYVRGARNITLSRFDPEAFYNAVATKGATSTFLVPTMIRMLLDHDPGPPRDGGGKLRGITYGGAPMPTALAEEAISTFGPILTQVYGSCEAPHPVSVLSRLDHSTASAEQLASAGHEALGVEIRILTPSGDDVEPGGAGELAIRGPNVMTGYWDDESATAAVMQEGWYRSGDIARRDEEGFLYIVGRERDMLISGGLNVYPAEVEAVLHQHPSISEAAVIGLPHPLWGEAVAAVVAFRPGQTSTTEELLDYCRGLLADYKKPRFIAVVPEIPKGATGKVAKDLRYLFS